MNDGNSGDTSLNYCLIPKWQKKVIKGLEEAGENKIVDILKTGNEG